MVEIVKLFLKLIIGVDNLMKTSPNQRIEGLFSRVTP